MEGYSRCLRRLRQFGIKTQTTQVTTQRTRPQQMHTTISFSEIHMQACTSCSGIMKRKESNIPIHTFAA
jgi:hypothetical protein